VCFAFIGILGVTFLDHLNTTPSADLGITVSSRLVARMVVMGSNILINPEGEFATLLSLALVSFTIGAETEPPRSYFGLAAVLVPFVGALAVMGHVPSDLAAALVFLVGP